MFVVPDKSVICNDNIPEIYNKNNLCRFINFIKENICSQKFIDLYEHCKLSPSDYYFTDTHINDIGTLKIAKTIMKYFIEDNSKINEIDNFLSITTILNFKGDLTSPLNLQDQHLITELELNENIEKVTNMCYEKYINKIYVIPVKYRFCYSRPSKYIYNENAIIKKTIFIYGSSTVSNKLFELLSFYFEKIFFYWNHYFINNDLINYINPDIIIDIRPERFLYINNDIYNNFTNYETNYDINNLLLTYDEIYSILVNIYDNYEFICIINNINTLREIKNNILIFSSVLLHYKEYIKPYIDINNKEALELNPDLIIFYDNKTDIEISDLKLLNFINNKNNNRKCKYENIPNDFNALEYIELNEDLRHMSEIEAKVYYENDGYKENRKYKYD